MSTTSHSTATRPEKPYPEFPLFAHATKRWAKKIRGNFHYFGPWDDPDGALKKYLSQNDDLHAGRTPRDITGELTVRDLVNRFLNSKRLRVDTGEMAARTWADYYAMCARVVAAFGKTRLVSDLAADDFERHRSSMAKKWGTVSIGNEIQPVRVLFKWGYDAGVIANPMRYGPGFERPSKKTLRKARAEKGPRMFEAEELRKILKAADQPLKAMILLGVNAGFGNADCGRPRRHRSSVLRAAIAKARFGCTGVHCFLDRAS